MQREATCSCGTLSVLCDGEPELVSVCHCVSCQKRTGSPYGIAAFFHKENVVIRGQYKNFERPSDSGFGLVFHFCVDCGSTVFWEPMRKPDMIAVGVGSFGDSGFPEPSQEVYTECRHSWVEPLKP